MITKITRKEAIDTYPCLPLAEWNAKEEEYDLLFPEVFATYTLTLPSKSFRGHIKLLGAELTTLIEGLGFDKLIFLGDIDIPWLKRDHDFKPAKKALQYLEDNRIGKRFNGGLQVNTTQLPAFVKRLAWLTRTNAIPACVYFTNPDQKFIGTICQYGNLHFSTINAAIDKVFKTKFLNTRFEFIHGTDCYNKFSKAGNIKGRQIVL